MKSAFLVYMYNVLGTLLQLLLSFFLFLHVIHVIKGKVFFFFSTKKNNESRNATFGCLLEWQGEERFKDILRWNLLYMDACIFLPFLAKRKNYSRKIGVASKKEMKKYILHC